MVVASCLWGPEADPLPEGSWQAVPASPAVPELLELLELASGLLLASPVLPFLGLPEWKILLRRSSRRSDRLRHRPGRTFRRRPFSIALERLAVPQLGPACLASPVVPEQEAVKVFQ
jgi:hypothetical protein